MGIKQKINFKNKKVLVFGLGLLGGGVATTNWLIKHGARVTVTDLKDENYLEPSLLRLKGKPKLRLNGHDKKDIEENEIIVFNPDVSVNNPFVKYAKKLGKQIENEATIFYKLCPRPIIAVTGTRGKTTTANWIGHFLGVQYGAVVSGNSYAEPLLKTLDRATEFNYVVNEVPSYHLEFFDPALEKDKGATSGCGPVLFKGGVDKTIPASEVAVITNLYQDHLNRHGTMRNYALAKAMIFKNQSANQHLVLNYDNKWTPFFLKRKPHGQVWFFSPSPLPKNTVGAFYKNDRLRNDRLRKSTNGSTNDKIYFRQENGVETGIGMGGFVAKWGEHNLQNLLASSLAAHLAGVPWDKIRQRIKTLPQIPFRQETIFENRQLKIINDTSATSPDGGIAALSRFAGPDTILITGGTDRRLDYSRWAKVVRNKIKPGNLIFLEGSATGKMIRELRSKKHELRIRKTLKECVADALETAGKYPKSVILFSPAAKSFEKFKNEFDRGRQFNLLVKREIKKRQR